MLFRTIYGQELEAIYTFLLGRQISVPKQEILQSFMPSTADYQPSNQNTEDALSFLVSSRLVLEKKQEFQAVPVELPFQLAVLKQLRALQLGSIEALHPIDGLFFMLFDQLFAKPNVLVLENLHTKVNQLESVKELGGISKEKVQAWKRVLEFLGFGYRVQNGFLASLSPKLILMILEQVSTHTMPLESFFEHHLSAYLPCFEKSGDVSQWIARPLLKLAKQSVLQLDTLQDSPNKAYFLPKRFKQISFERISYA